VVAGLTGRGGTVVAGEAGARNTGVINPPCHPGRSCMTIVAAVAAGNVSRRPALSNVAIMAICTCSNHRAVVNSRDDFPCERIVTFSAVVRGPEMIKRFLAGRYARCKGMARKTTARCSFEYAV
jgi:hypothetical protein